MREIWRDAFGKSGLLLVALAACTPAVDRPSSRHGGEDHPAIPEDEASLGRLWGALAPDTLPPLHDESMRGAPQTDVPQTDFGLAPYSRPSPVETLAPPSTWAADRPELSSLLLPAIESFERHWERGPDGYERIFETTHWLGSIRAETLAAFDRSARAAGLRLDDVQRRGLAFTLRYVGNAARVELSRFSRTEAGLRIALTIPGELRADPVIAAAIVQRPLLTRLSQRLLLRGARQHGSRIDFRFVLDENQPTEDEVAREGLIPTRCAARRSKGVDPRRCYLTTDASALVVTDRRRLDVLDEPHDPFD